MLAVPYLAGLIAAGFRWPDVPLVFAWLAGYLLSYYVLQAVKSRRWSRYRSQLVLYTCIAGPLTALVVAARPLVLVYAPVYAGLFAINAWYAFRRDERALVNDLVSVVQSCLMAFVVATVAGSAHLGTTAFVLCLAYFVGTVFYVKTMIRERGSVGYRRASIGYHVLALVVVAWISPWAAALFGWLLIRSFVLPGRGLRPGKVGVIEIVNSVLLLVLIAALA